MDDVQIKGRSIGNHRIARLTLLLHAQGGNDGFRLALQRKKSAKLVAAKRIFDYKFKSRSICHRDLFRPERMRLFEKWDNVTWCCSLRTTAIHFVSVVTTPLLTPC